MIKTALVGLGRMGRIHLRNLQEHPSADLMAVCSNQPGDEEWIRQQYPSLQYHQTLSGLLHAIAKDVDCIFLATPSILHPDQIKACLRQGLHVFCEKPLAVDEAGCQALERLAIQYGDQKLMVGFMRRFDPSYQELKQAVDDGRVGIPILFRAYSCDPAHLIDGYLPYAAHGAGHFLDMSIHDIDLMHWLLQSNPMQCMSTGGAFQYQELTEHGGDVAAAFMSLQNGAVASFYTSRIATQGYWVETELVGSRTTYRVLDDLGIQEVTSTENRQTHFGLDFEDRFAIAFKREVDYFIRAIRDNLLIAPSWADGLRATRTALMLQESFQMIKK